MITRIWLLDLKEGEVFLESSRENEVRQRLKGIASG